MARRALDIVAAFLGLILFSVPLAIILLLVWAQDRHSPFYVADRVGRDGRIFRMIKVRSMIVGADRTGVESTGASDVRITKLGHFIRRWKIDELSQLWNVLLGDMSLVGPRPNTVAEVATYTAEEHRLLSVRPGITDFSSIVFSDEGEILRSSTDPDADYARLIRPWKGRLGALYAGNPSVMLNIRIIFVTILAIFNKPRALASLQPLIARAGADALLCTVALREAPLDRFGATAA